MFPSLLPPRDNRNSSNGVPVIACPSTRIDASEPSEPSGASGASGAGGGIELAGWPVRGARPERPSLMEDLPHLSWQPRRRGATRSNRICSGKVIPRAGDRGHVWGLNPNGCRSTKSKHEANRSIEVFMSTGIDDGAGSKGGLDGLRFARPHANAGRAFVRRWGVEIGPRSRQTEGLWQELPADLSGPQVGRSPLQTLPSLARTRRNRRPRYVP